MSDDKKEKYEVGTIDSLNIKWSQLPFNSQDLIVYSPQ